MRSSPYEQVDYTALHFLPNPHEMYLILDVEQEFGLANLLLKTLTRLFWASMSI